MNHNEDKLQQQEHKTMTYMNTLKWVALKESFSACSLAKSSIQLDSW